jgi:hypothetical protein
MARKKKTPKTIPALLDMDDYRQSIVNVLCGYKKEAENNRSGGLNPRDTKWKQNTDLYYNRYDFTRKQKWQAKETMPEVPTFVDRFTGALKEALVSTPSGFYTIVDPYDTEHDMTNSLKSMMDVWLSACGKNASGTPLDFSAVFEEQMKLGAIMACCATVLWKNDVPGGRVAVETVDPQNVWLDHTYRDLYRLRRIEIDKHQIYDLLNIKTPKGNPVYNMDEISRMLSGLLLEEKAKKERLTGTGQEETSSRGTIRLDEYRATVCLESGEILKDNLFMVANDQYLLRGPEANPYWHGKDWMVYAPLVTAPLSVYGRSYMEDFGSIAKTFTELTNMLLDAVHLAGMKAYALVPSMLTNPRQAAEGVTPGKTFLLADGEVPKEFFAEISMGEVSPGAVQMWQAIKSELSEAAAMNEIGLGQLPTKTHIASSAVTGAQQSSSAVMRSVAQVVETRFCDPVLDLVWKTGLQHVSPSDVRMANAVGQEMYGALMARRKELIKHPITFQARGISTLIQKSQMLAQIIQIIQIIAQNEALVAAFMQVIDVNKLLNLLFYLSNVDLTKIQPTERERLAQNLAQAGQGGAAPTGAAQAEMGDVAQRMGVARTI